MELEDLLGGKKKPVAPKTAKGWPSPAKRPAATKPSDEDDEAAPLTKMPHPSDFLRPQPISFFAAILGKQNYQIAKRLSKCPVAAWIKRGEKEHPHYDFQKAIAYLVPPAGSIEDWILSKNAATLPPYINKMFWDSASARHRVMLAAGQLWHTEDVLLVLGRVAMLINEETKMWIEDLPERDMLTDEQYNALIDARNRLVDQVRERLVELPNVEQTRATMAHTIKEELDDAGLEGMGVAAETE